VKKTDQYTIYKKRNGRFGVLGKNKKWINGNEKAKILLNEGLIKALLKAPVQVEPEVNDSESNSAEVAATE
jgi:hypothetical protein